MKTKYRIKLSSGRVVGPFADEQILELYDKGHITGSEEAQIFPGGNWEKIDTYYDLAEIFHSDKSQMFVDSKKKIELTKSDISDNTQGKLDALAPRAFKEFELEDFELPKKEDPVPPNPTPTPPPATAHKTGSFKEFKFNKESNTDDLVDYKKLEEQYQQSEKARKEEEKKETPVSDEATDTDKTRIKKFDRNTEEDDNLNKTIVRANPIPFDEPPPEEKPKLEAASVVEEKVTPPPIENEKTQVISLDVALTDLKQKADKAENEIEQLIIESNKEEIPATPKKEKKEKKDKPKKRLGTKPIVIIAILAIIAVLYSPEEKKSLGDLKPVYAPISFPVLEQVMDPNRSSNELKEGIRLYNKGSYTEKLQAADKFRKSLELKFQDNSSALGWLILVYSELLPNVQDQEKANATLFRLIQLARGKVITDVNTAIGTANFYLQIKKYATALNVIENYLRVKGKPSSKLYALYLELLLKNSRWADARKVYEQLSQVKDPSLEVYLALSSFLNFDSKRDEAQTLLEGALKRFPNSVMIALEYSTYLLSSENFKKYEQVLIKIKAAQSEDSPLQIARYLEQLGMLSVVKKNQEQAAVAFKKALSIRESDELRSKLSALEIGGSQKVESLIRESKILDLISKSRAAEMERRWDDAFKFAIDASDFSDNYIPAQLWLSYIQTRRGYFDSAIQTLEKLQKDNMQNPQVQFALINAYIESRKLDLAQRNLAMLSPTKLGRTSDFAFYMGLFYRKMNNPVLAKKWFTDCTTLNPVNDRAYYEIADIYLEGRKLDPAKIMISKALDLDPENSTYHALTSRILYDKDGADVAIGYLRDLSEGKPEDPVYISEMAIFYYKSGKLKEFESYLKKVQTFANPPANFYEFLINVSRLEDKYDDIIKYTNELLKINPGNMEARLGLGETYLRKSDTASALSTFESVKERLGSYPRVNYWIARTYIALKDFPKAQKAAEEEIKFNPAIEQGYFILGECLRLQAKYPEALINLDKALTINGHSIETLFALGWIKHRQNYPGIARDYYAKILKIEQGNSEANKQLGLVYKDLGQSSLAIEHLKIYLDLNPGASDRAEVETMIKQF